MTPRWPPAALRRGSSRVPEEGRRTGALDEWIACISSRDVGTFTPDSRPMRSSERILSARARQVRSGCPNTERVERLTQSRPSRAAAYKVRVYAEFASKHER